MSRSYVRQSYDDVWSWLARTGQCDDHGGAEYLRVRAAWRAAGRPPPQSFILREANRPANQPSDQGIAPGRRLTIQSQS